MNSECVSFENNICIYIYIDDCRRYLCVCNNSVNKSIMLVRLLPIIQKIESSSNNPSLIPKKWQQSDRAYDRTYIMFLWMAATAAINWTENIRGRIKPCALVRVGHLWFTMRYEERNRKQACKNYCRVTLLRGEQISRYSPHR